MATQGIDTASLIYFPYTPLCMEQVPGHIPVTVHSVVQKLFIVK